MPNKSPLPETTAKVKPERASSEVALFGERNSVSMGRFGVPLSAIEFSYHSARPTTIADSAIGGVSRKSHGPKRLYVEASGESIPFRSVAHPIIAMSNQNAQHQNAQAREFVAATSVCRHHFVVAGILLNGPSLSPERL